MKILFVCKGNVGRSQIAEALFRKKYGTMHEAFSAGIQLSGPEQPISELLPKTKEVIDVMNEEGIDVSLSFRNQLTGKMVEDADRVIALVEEGEMLPEYLSGSSKLTVWNIPDPKGKDIEFTRNVREHIKKYIESL